MKEELTLFKALSDRTRFVILEFLLDGEKCVCEIYPHVKRTQSTVSIQLGKLESWGLLESRRDGKKVFYRISDYRVCDLFKAVGNLKGKDLKKYCCMEGQDEAH